MHEAIPKALGLAASFANAIKANAEDTVVVSTDDVELVWFAQSLQNFRAVVRPIVPDGTVYEVTYDGNKKQANVEEYQLTQSIIVRDEALYG